MQMTKNLLRQAWVQFVQAIEPNCIVTLSEGAGINPVTAQQRIDHFLNGVQRAALGRNWYKKPEDTRIRAVGFREHHLTNPHWHLAIHAPGDLFPALHDAKSGWSRLRHKGHAWADVIDFPANYAAYMTKHYDQIDTFENPYVYAPFVSQRIL
jgi:hypothetical protein